MKGITDYLSNNHQKLVNIVSIFSYIIAIPATIIGIWFTYYSIENTAQVVEQQLREQKKATSVVIVGDFLSELSNNLTNRNKDLANFEKVVITRTQLLIDTLDFPDLTSQILVFLGSNDFGYLFDSKRMAAEKFINLANSELTSGILGAIELKSPNFYCSNLKKSTLHGSSFTKASFGLSDLQGAKLIGTKFKEATFEWTNLRNSYIPKAEFTDSRILFSDLRGIKFSKDSKISRKDEVKEISNVLMSAKSLYGSVLDDDVKDIIINTKKLLLTEIAFATPLKNDSPHFPDITKIFHASKALSESQWTKEWLKRRSLRCKNKVVVP